jgi:hypothetical protein
MWYEASLKSDTITTAFQQNRELELGNEVKWTAKDLVKSGAVDELVRKAANMVKKMDGVGYFNDNQESELMRQYMPLPEPKKGKYLEKFW